MDLFSSTCPELLNLEASPSNSSIAMYSLVKLAAPDFEIIAVDYLPKDVQ